MRRRLALTPPLFGRKRSEEVFPQFVVEYYSTFSRGLLPFGGGKGGGTKDDDSKNWKPFVSSSSSSSAPMTSLFRGRFRPKLSTTTMTTKRAFLSSFTFPSFAASGASSIINEKKNNNNEERVIETYRKETDEKKKTKKKTKKKIPPDERRLNKGVNIRAEEILEKRRLERQRTPLSEARELHVLETTRVTRARDWGTYRKKKKKRETMTTEPRPAREQYCRSRRRNDRYCFSLNTF